MKSKTELNAQMEDVKGWINDASHKMSDQMSRLGTEIKKYSAKGVESTAETVSEHPLKSVGIAAACGFVLGYLIGRK